MTGPTVHAHQAGWTPHGGYVLEWRPDRNAPVLVLGGCRHGSTLPWAGRPLFVACPPDLTGLLAGWDVPPEVSAPEVEWYEPRRFAVAQQPVPPPGWTPGPPRPTHRFWCYVEVSTSTAEAVAWLDVVAGCWRLWWTVHRLGMGISRIGPSEANPLGGVWRRPGGPRGVGVLP